MSPRSGHTERLARRAPACWDSRQLGAAQPAAPEPSVHPCCADRAEGDGVRRPARRPPGRSFPGGSRHAAGGCQGDAGDRGQRNPHARRGRQRQRARPACPVPAAPALGGSVGQAGGGRAAGTHAAADQPGPGGGTMRCRTGSDGVWRQLAQTCAAECPHAVKSSACAGRREVSSARVLAAAGACWHAPGQQAALRQPAGRPLLR